jgi:hypothetical protein
LNCIQFVEHIESQSEGANNGEVDKDELLHFIEDGIALSSAERKEFGSRGVFHKMLVDFFTGIDKARYRFNQEKQINVNKHDQTNDASHEEEEGGGGGEKALTFHPHETRLLNLAIDSIWNDYDTDHSNTIDANEAKQMIVDITGNKKVSKRDVTNFIAHIEKEAFETTGEAPNGVLEREELVYFVQYGLALTDEQRETYASRGAFQKILVDFFDGFDKLLDKIANNENSGNDENDKAAEGSKKVADEKSGGEDVEEKLEKIKDANNTNDGDDPGFLGWCCSTRDGNA